MANVEGNADLDSPICLVIAYKKKKKRAAYSTNHVMLQYKPSFKLILKIFPHFAQ